MKTRNRNKERGFSLLLAIFMLMLLTAVAAGMMFMASTETSINGNFKSEEAAYFAARAGTEEARDRMLATNLNSISTLLPTTLPGAGGGVLYILQNGVTAANVTSLTANNPLADDEFCHDFPYGGTGYAGMTPVPANVRCTTLPSGGWYTTTASVAPYPLEYKWTRITKKSNNSTPYPVNGNAAQSNEVCWNGISEEALPAGTASCNLMTPAGLPVYLVTSLAVMPSGARRIVQQEIAQTLTGGLPGGLFATGTGCAALDIQGNARTGSFNSATESTPTNPPSNLTLTNGDVGANGGIGVGGSSTAVNGRISTLLPATLGNCPTSGVSTSGSPGIGTLVQLTAPYQPPVPPMPNPLPPTTNVTYRNTTLSPGSYGNVTIQGNVTLTGGTPSNPAIYTLNSLNLNGNATLNINGTVVINIAGVNQTTVVDLSGGSFANTTNVPSNFVINYSGTGNVKVAGGNQAYGVINAPNAAITLTGGSSFYGNAIGRTIDDHGGTNFYWDLATNVPGPSNNSYYEISLRELAY